MKNYWSHYPSLEKKLNEVQTYLTTIVAVKNKAIEDALQELLGSGGKLLRPAYFFMFSNIYEFNKQTTEKEIHAASSLELLHVATLIHDDIIDDSPKRRGNQTLQSEFGKDTAVYTGDLLFTYYFDLLIQTFDSKEILSTNATTMKKILLGELDQMDLKYNTSVSISDYIQAITGKTAQLFSLCCFEGMYFCGGSTQQQSLAREIGLNIGIAFQIIDDILDYSGKEKLLKKPVMEDVAQGVYTSPLLFALEDGKKELLPLLDKQSFLTKDEIDKIKHLVKKYNGIDKANQLSTHYTKKALSLIEELPSSEGKIQLESVTQRLLDRDY